MRLVLGSGSPRRKDLLETLGLEFDSATSGVDETRHQDELPVAYVERLARSKAEALTKPGSVVIGADTVVVLDGRVLGKPAHPDEARSMLQALQGKSHDVVTGLAVGYWRDGAIVESLVDSTEVTMLPLTEHEIDRYVASGEPMDKAGAYALQGEGGAFVESVSGSPFTVIGLPIHLLARLLARSGHEIDTFRAARRDDAITPEASEPRIGDTN